MVDHLRGPYPTRLPSGLSTGRPTGRASGTTVVWGLLRGTLEARAELARRPLDIIDAGGGTGGFAVPLAELGHRVTVVDRSPDALAALDRRAAEAGVTGRVAGRQGDLDGLLDVVPPASADVVLCHGVLEVVEDPAAALHGLVPCVRPGGLVSVLAANRHAVVLARALAGQVAAARHALQAPVGRSPDADPAPRRFTSSQLATLLADAGLRVDSVHGLRVFTDLVPALADLEGADADALLALEAAAADHPAFREIAATLHVLATAPDGSGAPAAHPPPRPEAGCG